MSNINDYDTIRTLAQVREIARSVRIVKEIYLNEESQLVSFKNTPWHSRINI